MGFFFKKNIKTNDISQSGDKEISRSVEINNPDPKTKSITNQSLPYDKNNIFTISQSEDGNLHIFRDLFQKDDYLNIYFENRNYNIFINQKFPNISNATINVFFSAIGNYGFAITTDTSYHINPHMSLDLYLYNNSGDELIHINYLQGGYRTYKFSSSGRYFVLMEQKRILTYDMKQGRLYEFYADDMENSDFNDFIIFEDQELVAFCYTQHPDQPFYHFTFSGQLIEKDAFQSQIDKMNKIRSERRAFDNLWFEIEEASHPIPEEKLTKYINELVKYSKTPEYNNAAWLYRKIGELELELSHNQLALNYFEKALEIDPHVGVKRTITKLKRELENN